MSRRSPSRAEADQGRRAFLRGNFANSPVRVSADCLAAKGVVCQACADSCAPRAIAFPPRIGAIAQPRIDAARCTRCGVCAEACPVQALTVNAAAPGAMHGA